jgi:hypothetical protein
MSLPRKKIVNAGIENKNKKNNICQKKSKWHLFFSLFLLRLQSLLVLGLYIDLRLANLIVQIWLALSLYHGIKYEILKLH